MTPDPRVTVHLPAFRGGRWVQLRRGLYALRKNGVVLARLERTRRWWLWSVRQGGHGRVALQEDALAILQRKLGAQEAA